MAAQAEVLKNRQEIETWIAGLLKRLNDYARAAESEVIMRKAFFEIEKASKKLTPEFVNYTVSVEEAVKRLPEIDAYAKQVLQAIENAKKGKRWDDLYNIRDRIGYFVRAYVRILPDKGDIGRKKQATKAALKQGWSDVAKALKDIPKALENEFTQETAQYPSSLAFVATPVKQIGIDEAEIQIRQAKTIQEAERLAEGMTKEADRKWRAFQEQFAKENPPGNEHPQYKSQLQAIEGQGLNYQTDGCTQAWKDYLDTLSRSTSDATRQSALRGYENCLQGYSAREKQLGEQRKKQIDDLIKVRNNYDQKRKLYRDSVEQQYHALVKGIGKLTEEKRAQYADIEKLKKEAFDKLEVVDRRIPAFYPATATKGYEVTAADTKQYLNRLKSQKSDGYLGLPKMKFPAWGDNGTAVIEYIEGIKRKIANESNNAYQLEASHRRAMEYISGLKKFLSENDRYAQEMAEAKERIYALKLQSDPKAQALTDIEKRVNGMKDVEKVALDVESEVNNRLMADNQKQLASIQDDLAYLASLRRKVEYWGDTVQMYSTPLYKFGGSVNAAMVSIAMATEGSSGSNRRIFLAPSPSSTDLFDRAKANAAADALLKEVAQTGIAKWDPNGDTGLKAMLEKKAAEIRNYYIDTPDYAIVNGNVVYAKRIAKMAADVKAIPTSSYGTYTYKEGIRNRTFDEKLGAALRNGTAFAMDIEMKTNSDEQSVSVSLDTAKKLAAGHKSAAIKTASSDLVKEIDQHVKRYNAHTAQEAKQRAIDYAKSEAEMKLQNECLAKGGVYTNGKCTTMPGGPGQAGRPGQPGQMGQPGQQAGVGAGTPPAGVGAGKPQTGAGSMMAQAGTQPSGMPQGPAQPSGQPQASALPTGASAKPQTPPSGPQSGQQGAPAKVQASSAGPGMPQQAPPAQQPKAAAAPSMPSQTASLQQPKPGAMGSMPPQPGSMQQPKPGAMGSMPPQAGAMGSMPPQAGSMPQKPGIGPMASAQGAGSTPAAVDMTPKVKELYNQLKQSYESKNMSGVAGCISSQWQASDGTTMSSLQANLTKAFKTYDEIRCTIQNLNISKIAEGKYKAAYAVVLSVKINKTNTKQEERYNVTDEVAVDNAGKAKIAKTLSGKFWPK